MSSAAPIPRRMAVPNQRDRARGESIAATASRSSRSGSVPSASMCSVSMKDSNSSAIFVSALCSADDAACSPSALAPVMISRTACSALSRSSMNAPVLGLSSGISAVRSQAPLTWRKRSSCGRTERSKPSRSNTEVVMVHTLTTPAPRLHGPEGPFSDS